MLGKQLRYFYRDTNKWSLFTVIILLLITVPIATIFFKLLYGPGESWSHIVDNILLDYTLNSIWLILGSCILTFVFGVSSAWIVSRYHLPFIKTMEWFLILPLAIPSYITAYAYAGFFNYGGLFEMFQKLFHLPVTKFNITNIYGLVFVLGISLFPYVYAVSYTHLTLPTIYSV